MTRTATRTYRTPRHAQEVGEAMLDEATARNEELASFTRETRLGIGIRFTMMFRPAAQPARYRFVAAHGRLRDDNPVLDGGHLVARQPMTFLGLTTGYYAIIRIDN